MTKLKKLFLLFFSVLLITSPLKSAQAEAHHSAVLQLTRFDKNTPVSSLAIQNSHQAARLVKNRFGGKVLKVKKVKSNGKQGYKVKVLKDNGHVITVFVNAQTGKAFRR